MWRGVPKCTCFRVKCGDKYILTHFHNISEYYLLYIPHVMDWNVIPRKYLFS